MVKKTILITTTFLFFLSPLFCQYLIYPEDKAIIQGNNMFFKWDGDDLIGDKKLYKLTIKEIQKEQNTSTAIVENNSIIEEEVLNNGAINISLERLKKRGNKSYIWQIIAFDISNKEEKEISKSKIRRFTFHPIPDFTKWLSIDSTITENKSQSRMPPPPTNCSNANLEMGNLQDWDGYFGSRSGSSTVNLNNLSSGILNGRHTIRQVSDGDDPIVGGNIIPQVIEGNYSLRLGNSSGGAQADLIKYTFTVDQQNKNFSFKYALVLEDPDHDPGEQPFFTYYILKGSSILFSISNLPIAGQQVIADTNNPFFKSANGVIYREWTPTCVDLSNYIGETMTIVFLTTDCSFTQHFGYAYIDALCESNEAVASFTMPTEICQDENLIVDGSASVNETSYFWSIEESDASGGRPNPSSEVYDWVIAQQAGNSINYSSLYQSKGKQFKCNTYYRIKLAVNNDCTPWNEEVKLLHVKCPPVNAGNNINSCCTVLGTVILGTSPVPPNVSYEWFPKNGLISPYSSVTLLDLNSFSGQNFPYQQQYTLVATDDDGCQGSDVINLNICCQPDVAVNIQRESTCNNNAVISYDDISTPSNCEVHSIKWQHLNSSANPITVNTNNTSSLNLIVTGICGNKIQTVNLPSYPTLTGAFPSILCPNVITPNNDGINDNYLVSDNSVSSNHFPAYNADGYQFLVYDRWGSLVANMSATSTSGFTNQTIPNFNGTAQFSTSYNWWQRVFGGRVNSNAGQKLSDGTYFYIFKLKNCSNGYTDICNGYFSLFGN